MPAQVKLQGIKGKVRGREVVFTERTTCLVGRAEDCQLRVPNDPDHKEVSRHHCLLDVNPPDVRARDLGSRNGTYVNGKKIGQRPRGEGPEGAAGAGGPEYDLHDGDTLEVGPAAFRVRVVVPAVCARCEAEFATGPGVEGGQGGGVVLCRRCHDTLKLGAPAAPAGLVIPAVCAHCGREVAGGAGDRRAGQRVCADCQAQPLQLVQDLLRMAGEGDREVLALKGYQVVRELGRGGMGAVYLIRHEATGEQVALKVMLPRVAVQPAARELFLREAENTRVLHHPNVVELRQAGSSQGTFYFTLEYCDGGNVLELMDRHGGKLPLAEAAPIVLQALDGLEYAHNAEVPQVPLSDGTRGRGRGLVHRDLSPQNLFLAGAGPARRTKVGDYGLAKAFDLAGLSGQTMTGAAGGKPYFMPRQQLVNFKYARPEVDVWAMAACFYTMLTRRPPRDFPPGRDPWRAVLESRPVPLRQREPSVPQRVAEVIDQALVDDPEISFKTAADLKRALEAVL